MRWRDGGCAKGSLEMRAAAPVMHVMARIRSSVSRMFNGVDVCRYNPIEWNNRIAIAATMLDAVATVGHA